MATRIKLRRDTAANWLEQNPILAQGETGFETDTRTMKLGDGATAWKDLKYAVTGDLKITDDSIHGDMEVSLSSGIGNRENWIALTQANMGDVNSPIDAETDGIAVDSQGNIFSSYWLQYMGLGGTGLQKISPSGEVLWNNYYNEYAAYGWGLNVDHNDNIIMILTEYDSSSDDVVLVKISGDDGSIIWQKYLNSFGDYDDYASCLDVDSYGNIYITGGSYNGNNSIAYVAKFNGANGSLNWSKQYDVDGLDSYGTGLTVDKDGNVGIVGSTYDGENTTFVNMFKLNGVDGSILWQGKIVNVKWDNGNNDGQINDDIHFANIQSSDVTSDAQGNFYLTFGWYSPYYPGMTALVAKFNGSTGKSEWARALTYDNYIQGSGSIICDELNNVYVSSSLSKYKTNYDIDSSNRITQNITKINSTGSIVWQRWLSKEQGVNRDGKDNEWKLGQSIRVTKDYVIVAGNYYFVNDYSNDNQYWYTQPYVAQLNRDGGEFEISGWKFTDSSKDLTTMFASIINDDNNWIYDSADVSDFGFDMGLGDVGYEMNSDTAGLVYINKSNVNKVTFSEKTLSLPKGGAIEVSREKNGYITAIGTFDGTEGGNNNGEVWLNGSARDDNGGTYAAGGWYTYDTWNDWSSYENIPMVFKTDSDGKLIWQAGNALDQDWSSPDLVDVVYHKDTNTVIALGNDGELDGHEGFNILYLDADTGSMKQDITHIRPAEGSNDIDPRTLDVMSDGTPVVSGYITSANATYENVTDGAAGLTGSTNSGTLVLLKSKFTVEGSTEYPQEDGTWYMYPDSAMVYSVNRYGHDEAYPTIAYTGTLGSGATFDVSVASGAWTGIAINNGGSGYKPGQKVKLLGTSLGGTTPLNDLYLFVSTVDGNGTITDITGDTVANTIPSDGGPYLAVATTAVAGTGLQGWVQYNPSGTEYTLFNIDSDSNGTGYGVGDTVKILGTLLGGTTPENDLTITVTSINGVGSANGGVTNVTLAGTPQSTNIKIYGGGLDYTQTGTYNIVHELASDGFIWTPNWSKVFGTSGQGYVYDDFHALTLDTSDNVIVGGYSDGTGLDSGTTWYGWNQTGIITKFSSEGEILWTKSIDGSEGGSTVWSVATDMDDNIYSVMQSGAEDDPYITKLTSDGDFVWQQSIGLWNSNAWAIDVTDNGDVLIAGECWNWWFSNDYHQYNDNILIVKYDKDGNLLFSRILWSQNGIYTNNHADYGNGLTIKGDRFSFVAYSSDPGGDNYQGIVIDLPLDGTGVGDYGDFHYEEIEIDRRRRFENNNDANGYQIVTDITSTIVSRPYTFVDAPYVDNDAWRNVSIYGDRDYKAFPLYKPEGGEVKGVAKITFEDGSVQTTSMQGLPQVDVSRVNGGENDYWLRPEDNGKHILQKWSSTVIIPSPDRVRLPIGFAITIINQGNNSGVWSENYDEYIYLSGNGGSGDFSYEIPQWSMATLVKITSDEWMIAGSNLSSGWW